MRRGADWTGVGEMGEKSRVFSHSLDGDSLGNAGEGRAGCAMR